MHTITYIGSSFYRSYERVIMKQLELFRDSRITRGLRLMREELKLQFKIQGYRAELRKLSQWDDPTMRETTKTSMHPILLCYESLDRTRHYRKNL
jgi:hypothetical protein